MRIVRKPDDGEPESRSVLLVDERCECGNLLCKLSEETVEIKCRRCKRIHIIPVSRLLEKNPRRGGSGERLFRRRENKESL